MSAGASREAVERLLASAPFNEHYRFRLGPLRDGECTLEIPFRHEFARPGGVVAGPVFVAAADAAMWLAIVSRLGGTETWVTVDLKTAFLRAARQEPFRCTARVLKTGRQMIYGVAECVRGDGALLSHHTLTYARLPRSPDTLGARE